MTPIVTKQSLQQMLNDADDKKRARIIGRALVVLLNNQTNTERNANTTHSANNIGFSCVDAKSGSLTAKYYLAHKTLAVWQVERWMRQDSTGFARICKYHAQLNESAQTKQRQMQLID